MKKHIPIIVLLLLIIPSLAEASWFNKATGVGRTTISHSSPAITNGLVGYWTFDGKDTNWATGITQDLSGQGNNGSLVSMSTTTTPVMGKIGQGLKFDGTNDVIDMGSGHFPFTKTTPFSGSAWIKTTQDGQVMSNFNYLVSPGWMFGIGVSIGFGKLELSINDLSVGAGRGAYGSTAITDGKFHHVAFTYDGSNTAAGIKLYVDGQSETLSTTSNTDPGTLVDNNFKIGAVSTSPFGYFNGTIDDSRIYNRVLSATEVALLYKLGSAKVAVSQTALLSNGLVGYWTFDGKDTAWTSATAGTTRDISGAGNMATGTMTNMVQTISPVAGKVGQGLGFDGVDDYVTATSTVIGDITTEITAAFWVNTTQLTSSVTRSVVRNSLHFSPLTYKGSAAFHLGLCSRTTSGTSSSVNISLNGVFTDGKWHHYACSYSSVNGFRVYKDGALYTSSAVTGTMDTTTNPVCFGAACEVTPTQLWRGSLDDIRFYNRVLSDAEVKLLYDLTR